MPRKYQRLGLMALVGASIYYVFLAPPGATAQVPGAQEQLPAALFGVLSLQLGGV